LLFALAYEKKVYFLAYALSQTYLSKYTMVSKSRAIAKERLASQHLSPDMYLILEKIVHFDMYIQTSQLIGNNWNDRRHYLLAEVSPQM
jgi:hypothetical protein